jgi:hypothetical protein
VAKHDFEDIDRNSNGLIDGAEFIFWVSWSEFWSLYFWLHIQKKFKIIEKIVKV